MAAARETSGKEADLSAELASVRSELAAATAEKGELEEALGLMEKNNSAQVAALQVRHKHSSALQFGLIAHARLSQHDAVTASFAAVSSLPLWRLTAGCCVF
jgi:hypothetical protein